MLTCYAPSQAEAAAQLYATVTVRFPQVNARLSREDGDSVGYRDLAFPKVQFPVPEACPSCRLPRVGQLSRGGAIEQQARGIEEIRWNVDEVVRYLSRWVECASLGLLLPL